MQLILCRVVESSCLQTHNIVPHISWHDLPYHRTTKRYEDFEGMVIFLLPPQKFAIRTWFCNCPQYLCLFRIVVECSSSTRFCFFPANFMSSTYTDKNNPFSRCTKRHSQFGIFSQPCFNRIFSTCLSHNSPAKR